MGRDCFSICAFELDVSALREIRLGWSSPLEIHFALPKLYTLRKSQQLGANVMCVWEDVRAQGREKTSGARTLVRIISRGTATPEYRNMRCVRTSCFSNDQGQSPCQ